MGISGIIRFLKGYLVIRVEGLNLEKFINMSVAHGLVFRDVKRLSLTVVELTISIRGYRKLKKFIKKTGSRVSIINKEGMPFLFLKLKRRKMMAVGFALFILLIFMLSSFIWSIEITGTRTVSTEDIKQNLYELGVKPGAFKLGVAVSEVENNMLIRMGSISWIKVKLSGTRAEVEVKERIIPPKVVPGDKPCSIVAARDGIITKIVSSRGDVLVARGDPVKKGQTLVTGIIERENADVRYVHAFADIKARTWYESKYAVPIERIIKSRNGNKATKVYIKSGAKVFNIKNTSIPYKSYDKIVKSTKLIDTDRFQLPVEIVIEEYYETVNKVVTLKLEDAKSEAADSVEKSIIDSLPPDAKIINKKINITVKDDVVIASALIETIEDIGVQEEIKINGEV